CARGYFGSGIDYW
nr:immunoglobulin heavy chain junction region [Macaca mulatta]MOV35734.1 immunoglobulin heavy chain junction region [Macaca mulatta]